MESRVRNAIETPAIVVVGVTRKFRTPFKILGKKKKRKAKQPAFTKRFRPSNGFISSNMDVFYFFLGIDLLPQFYLAINSEPCIFCSRDIIIKMKLEGELCSNKASCCLKTFCQEAVNFCENVGV